MERERREKVFQDGKDSHNFEEESTEVLISEFVDRDNSEIDDLGKSVIIYHWPNPMI